MSKSLRKREDTSRRRSKDKKEKTKIKNLKKYSIKILNESNQIQERK